MIRAFSRLARWIRWLGLPRIPRPPGLVLYSERIVERHRRWIEEETPGVHPLSECRSTFVRFDDPDEAWKCCPFWQRKLSNKLIGKEFAIHNGVRCAEVLWKGKDVRSLRFEDLPVSYVIKTSIGWSSRQVLAMKDGRNLLDRKRYTQEAIIRRYERLMSEKPYSEDVVFVEEMLSDRLLPDYKLYIFHGKVERIEYIDRAKRRMAWFDRAWSPADPMSVEFPLAVGVPLPGHLDELVECGERLGRAYGAFVRVDLYCTPRGVFFGEFTPFSARGIGFADRTNQEFGHLLMEPGQELGQR